MRVAVMQPYFMPYAGYFRLFAAADLFVAFDCVQFPRRGWVHRNRFTTDLKTLEWLTLPIEKAPRDTTRICDLQFRGGAQPQWCKDVRAFPALRMLEPMGGELAERVLTLSGDPTEFILSCLAHTTRVLGLDKPIVRSSRLDIDPGLRAQDRIIAIVRSVGGSHYLNSPGGRGLYDPAKFHEEGLSLQFLSDYAGSVHSILERLILEPPSEIAAEIYANLNLDDA